MDCLPSPFFFIGSPGSPASLRGDVLSLNAPDTYEGLPAKVWALYAFLLENLEFDYFLRLDDDSVPYISRIYSLLFSIYAENGLESRPDYIGATPSHLGYQGGPDRTYHYGKVSDPALNIPYDGEFKNDYLAGGMGLLLSRRAIQYIVDHGYDRFHDPREFYEDKAHGDVLAEAGITPIWAGDELVTTDQNATMIQLMNHLQNGAGCGAPEFSSRWRGAIMPVEDQAEEEATALCPGEQPSGYSNPRMFEKWPTVKRRMFVVWTGNNPLTPKRIKNLELMKSRVGIPVILVTVDNIDEFLVAGHPLHPGYQFLSETHRADYLRCYLMHHHGGAYADIKPWNRSWTNWFDALEESNALVAGYQSEGPHWTANEELKPHWKFLIGYGGFIFRPGTELTKSWYADEQQAMDRLMEQGLPECPAVSPQDCAATTSSYFVPWSGVGGMVFDPNGTNFRRG